jgi:hypothetical protein
MMFPSVSRTVDLVTAVAQIAVAVTAAVEIVVARRIRGHGLAWSVVAVATVVPETAVLARDALGIAVRPS